MRQTISGLVAAIAVVAASAAPASACGLFESTCGQSYVAAPIYSGCNCGGVYERLPDPAYQYGVQSYPAVHQYYYADQGPTFTGPGNFAPHPTYQEGALPYYGGYHSHPHYRPGMPTPAIGVIATATNITVTDITATRRITTCVTAITACLINTAIASTRAVTTDRAI